jgi:hypothetical protein
MLKEPYLWDDNHVRFYFRNSVALILYKTIYNDFPKTAVYVRQDRFNRGKPKDTHYYKVEESRLENSIKICKKFSIDLEIIDWEAFTKLRKIRFESSLINECNQENSDIIFQTSDAYTVIGFSNYLNFPFTKIRLNLNWKSVIDIEEPNSIYIFNPNKLAVPNIYFKNIDLDCARNCLIDVSSFIQPYLFKKSEINLYDNEKYILVLPPSNLAKTNYHNRFMNEVFEIANSLKKKIIIKPHRNDLYDYKEYLDSKIVVNCNLDVFKYFEVEYLLGHKNIDKIIACPSSSLVFTDYSKLLIFAPKEQSLFRRHMIDQLVFLQYSGLTYKKI